MSGVLDRLEAAAKQALGTSGKVPAFLHCAPDVYDRAIEEARGGLRSFLLYVPATEEIGIKLPDRQPIPVRRAVRLAPGYVVPVMPLEKPERAIGLAGEGIVSGETPFPSQAAIEAHRRRMGR